MSQQQRLHLIIHGLVQGVGYRASAAREATRLGLTGWVRNAAGGEVELVAEGAEAALRALGRWCQAGPPAARVARVDETWAAASGEFSGFAIMR